MPSPYQVTPFPHPVFNQQQLVGKFNFPTNTVPRKNSFSTFGGALKQIFARNVIPEVEDESSSFPPPPLKLGAPGGPEIDNKHTILSEIDKLLGVDKPPAVEFIFVEPYASMNVYFIQGLGLSRNPYGHAAIRYTLPDGTQKVMNIVGFKTETNEMVNFIPPEEYFFGTGKFSEGCEQMGVYNRNFVSIRIEDYPPEKIMDLDYYFQKLQRRAHEQKATYSLITAPVWNFLREWLPFPLEVAERGNCALWTSKGLVEADLLRFPNAWPKSIFVDLYENWGRRDRNNINVVSYRRVNQAQLSYGKPLYTPSAVEPLNTLHNLSYINLEKFADVIVEVPENSTRAVARRQEPQLQPSMYRHYKLSITAGTCVALYGIYRLLRRK